MSAPGTSPGMCSGVARHLGSSMWSQLVFGIGREMGLFDSGYDFVEPTQMSKSCLHAALQLPKLLNMEPAQMCLYL